MRWIVSLIFVGCLTGCAGQVSEFDGDLNTSADRYFFEPISDLQYGLADLILDANDGGP